MATYTIEIPGWRPTLDNELKCHPLAAHRKKARDARALDAALARLRLEGRPVGLVRIPRAEADDRRRAGIGPLPGDPAPRRRRVTIRARGRWSKFPDMYAFHKSALDALVTVGVLVDDGAAWCEAPPGEFARGELRTEITIEDL